MKVPFGWVHQATEGMTGTLGDIAIGDKHVLYSHLKDNPDGPLSESTGTSSYRFHSLGKCRILLPLSDIHVSGPPTETRLFQSRERVDF